MSRRACSTIERRTSRPMRPKPLMATRTGMGLRAPEFRQGVLWGPGPSSQPLANLDLPGGFRGAGAGGLDGLGAGQGDAHAAALIALRLAEQAKVRAFDGQGFGDAVERHAPG